MIICASLLFLLFFSCTSDAIKSSANRFCIEEISCSFLEEFNQKTRALTKEEESVVDHALTQNYYYFGCGGQCYIFFSEEGNYVLKLFKSSPYALPQWMQTFPFPFLIQNLKNKKSEKRKAKRDKVFSAFQFCFEDLAEETGILYVHLRPTTHLKKQLNLIGPNAASHTIDLDSTEFVIQKRAELSVNHLDALMHKGSSEGAKQAITDLLALHFDLYKRGYRNRDANFKSNYGFIDGKPIVFDVGRFVYSPQKNRDFKKEIHKTTPRLRTWIENNHPELILFFDEVLLKYE